ncbi:MAG: chromosomal replication initiator protein DnaA [Candidatus Berkelbacteria bacterium]|nr:chromosomal replication initiator protein DnaA [Candidatus Berkelbacteria bacterium]
MAENDEKIWQSALGELEIIFAGPVFKTWFSGVEFESFDDGVFTLLVPTIYYESNLRGRFENKILEVLKKQLGDKIKSVDFRVSTSPKKPAKPVDNLGVINRPVNNFDSFPQVGQPVDKSKNETLNDDNTFENFVVGTSNQLAHAAAKSVSEKPGKSYNPLYVYGDSGLGKTHLIQAIGHRVVERQPKAKIIYVSCETFTNEFIDSVQSGKAKEFKDRYRNADLLIIDDIQFLGKMEKTQEEFFHTFNHLHQKKKQVVLASDRVPREIKGLEKRLQTRFEWGMVADIQTADYETRCAILQSKCEEKNFPLAEEIIQFIAQNITTNIRELEGALIKLIVNCEFTHIQPTLEIAEKILADIVTENQKNQPLSVDKILKAIQKYYKVPVDDIISKKRSSVIIRPRHVAMYLIKNMTELSTVEIGRVLGGKDHTTVIHGCKAIDKEAIGNKNLRDEIAIIKAGIFD